MDNVFLETVNKSLEEKSIQNKWDKKCKSFIQNFEYLNSSLLIEDQMQKLLCVGVNSISFSTELIKNLTSENISIIEDKLGGMLSNINDVITKFELLDKTLNQKKGFFQSKEPIDIFFELFEKEESNIQELVKELGIKKTSLVEIKNSLNDGINQIYDAYTLLERDVSFLSDCEQKIKNYPKELVRKAYSDNEFELMQIKTDLLTQQQILFQKFGAIKILLSNVSNCHKNIDYIAKVSFSVIMNTVELQKIIQLKKSQLSEKEILVLKKLKETLTVTSTDMKLVAAQPYNSHFN